LDSDSVVDLGCERDGEDEAKGVAEGCAAGQGRKRVGKFVEAAEKFPALLVKGCVEGCGDREEVFLKIRHEAKAGGGDEDLEDSAGDDETGADEGQTRAGGEGGGDEERNGGLLANPGEPGVASGEDSVDEG
jgi:hypothetical protein